MLRMPEDQNISKTAADPGPTRHFRVFTSAGETPPEELPVQRAARGVEVRNHEEEVRFDDGQVVQLYGSAIPLRDPTGAPRGSIGAFVDVTRLKQAEAALREADRRKDEFLALLSHELRNPLAPILTAAELMQLRGDVATPREREVIVRQAKHLVRLVDDLLDVSRVARGKVTLSKRPVELAAVVAKAVEAAGPLLEQRRHALHVAVPPDRLTVEGDEVRLTQVVSNLLTNAARYTPPGGRIDVTGARERNEVVLRVRDNGTGIEPALLPHLFDMFVQGPRGPDRAEGGLGLGLSLVRTLTALHGGTVSAHSEGRAGCRRARAAGGEQRRRADPGRRRQPGRRRDDLQRARQRGPRRPRGRRRLAGPVDGGQLPAAGGHPRHRVAGDGRLLARTRAARPLG